MDIREIKRLEEKCMFGALKGKERDTYETMLWEAVMKELQGMGITVDEELASYYGVCLDGLKERLYELEQAVKNHAETVKSDHSKCVVLFDCLEHFIVYWCKNQ